MIQPDFPTKTASIKNILHINSKENIGFSEYNLDLTTQIGLTQPGIKKRWPTFVLC